MQEAVGVGVGAGAVVVEESDGFRCCDGGCGCWELRRLWK